NRDIAQGMSTVGPHRDDLKLLVNDIDMSTFSSRGQQRTIALSLKLAERELLLRKTGEEPVLLLDDVLSELDAQRRTHLLESAIGQKQALLTTTELDRIEPRFLAHATVLEVREGRVVAS
ncbi:MAG: DNA replication and repair protein RecF, partial [Dehalococcoidia bacterium]